MPDERITQETLDAAQEVYTFLLSKLQDETGVHLGTLIASAARLAGTTLMRSFNLPLNGAKPGTIILSEQANEEGPALIGLLLAFLKTYGTEIKDNKMVIETPKEHAPRTDLLTTQLELQEGYRQATEKFGLDDRHAAYAGTIACGMFILEAQKAVDPSVSCGIAAYSFLESMKTAPIPLTSSR